MRDTTNVGRYTARHRGLFSGAVPSADDEHELPAADAALRDRVRRRGQKGLHRAFPPMKIIRYQDASGQISYGSELLDGTILRIEGDIFGTHRVTGDKVKVAKLLAPLLPTEILGVRLNYRPHRGESGVKMPEVPVLFVRDLNTVQNP